MSNSNKNSTFPRIFHPVANNMTKCLLWHNLSEARALIGQFSMHYFPWVYLLTMFRAHWCEATWHKRSRQRNENENLSEFCLFFFTFLLNLKSYTFRIHSSIVVKDFHRQLRVKLFKCLISFFVFIRNCASQCKRLFNLCTQLKLKEIAVKHLKVVL